MGLAELPVSVALVPQFTQESALWIEDLDPIIAIFRHVDVAITVYRQTLRPDEIPVSDALTPPLAQESALWIEDLDPIIAIFRHVDVAVTVYRPVSYTHLTLPTICSV